MKYLDCKNYELLDKIKLFWIELLHLDTFAPLRIFNHNRSNIMTL